MTTNIKISKQKLLKIVDFFLQQAIVRHLPGAGWAMALNAYLFLTRRFDKDRAHIERMINYYADSKHAYQVNGFDISHSRNELKCWYSFITQHHLVLSLV